MRFSHKANKFLERNKDFDKYKITGRMRRFVKIKNDGELWFTKPNFTRKLKIIDDTVGTITTSQNRIPNSGFVPYQDSYRILTEIECLRFMGFSENSIKILIDTHKPRKNNKVGILYKQAGNSIVVQKLESIIKFIKNS